jgi:hypothetical protein
VNWSDETGRHWGDARKICEDRKGGSGNAGKRTREISLGESARENIQQDLRTAGGCGGGHEKWRFGNLWENRWGFVRVWKLLQTIGHIVREKKGMNFSNDHVFFPAPSLMTN